MSEECSICGRALSNTVSVVLGVGPECRKKAVSFVASCDSSETELEQLEAAGDKAAIWIRNFRTEMRKGSKRRATYCIEAARRAAQSMIEA